MKTKKKFIDDDKIFFIFIFVLLFTRNSEAILNAQFFAEEGKEFFKNAYEQKNIFTTYMEYCHLIPNIVAYVCVKLSVLYSPLLFHVATLIINTYCCFYFSLNNCEVVVENKNTRRIASIFIACNPLSHEILGNLTNIQWYLNIYVILYIFSDVTNKFKYYNHTFIVFCILTSPTLILIVPILFFKPFKLFLSYKERLISGMLILFYHAILFVNKPSWSAHNVNNLKDQSFTDYVLITFELLTTRIIGATLSCSPNTGNITISILYKSLVILIILIITTKLTSKITINKHQYHFIISSIYLTVSSILLYLIFRKHIIPDFDKSILNLEYSCRYFFLGSCLLILMVIIYTQYLNKYLFTFLSIPFLLTILYNFFNTPSYVEMNWPKHAKMIENNPSRYHQIPINPQGWYIQIGNLPVDD